MLVKELFPELPDVIFPGPGGIPAVRRAAEDALASVDMSMIKSEHSVNVLASHHGFTLLGGEPYAEMLKTLKDVIERRTGCKNIRLRAGVGLRFRETEEYIRRHGLDAHFGGKAIGVAPIDQAIPIETEIGTLYGIKRVYDADWIVHAHNSDVREVHFHRQVDRAVKPFGMSYARIETRSTYHQNLGPRAANFTARAIFDSPFVQKKFAFAAFLSMSPNGILGVDADRDLYALNERVTRSGCSLYGRMMTLFGEIDECVVALDFPRPVVYTFAAGVIYANFAGAEYRPVRPRAPAPRVHLVHRGVLREEGPPAPPRDPPAQPGHQDGGPQLRVDGVPERLLQRAHSDRHRRPRAGGALQSRRAERDVHEAREDRRHDRGGDRVREAGCRNGEAARVRRSVRRHQPLRAARGAAPRACAGSEPQGRGGPAPEVVEAERTRSGSRLEAKPPTEVEQQSPPTDVEVRS